MRSPPTPASRNARCSTTSIPKRRSCSTPNRAISNTGRTSEGAYRRRLAVWDAVGVFFVEFVSGSAAKLEVQRRVMLASPQLAGRSGAVSQRLQHFLRRWVERRLDTTVSSRFDTALLVGTALSVMATAFSAWNPDDGFDHYLALLRQGFASVRVEARR